MDTSSTFVVPESVAVSDSGFLFLASSGETFTLNPVGKEMFTLLKEGVSLSAIKEKLLDEYDVEATTLERDVEDFLNQLKTYKLVSNK